MRVLYNEMCLQLTVLFHHFKISVVDTCSWKQTSFHHTHAEERSGSLDALCTVGYSPTAANMSVCGQKCGGGRCLECTPRILARRGLINISRRNESFSVCCWFDCLLVCSTLKVAERCMCWLCFCGYCKGESWKRWKGSKEAVHPPWPICTMIHIQ